MSSPDVFAALANPVRRRILEMLREQPRTVNAIADEFRLHRPAVSEHLQVLRAARLVRDERRGRERHYHLKATRLREVQSWLRPFEQYWLGKLDALKQTLDEEQS